MGHICTISDKKMFYLFCMILFLLKVDAQYFKEKIEVMSDYDWENFFLGLVERQDESEEPLFPKFPLTDTDFRLINFY